MLFSTFKGRRGPLPDDWPSAPSFTTNALSLPRAGKIPRIVEQAASTEAAQERAVLVVALGRAGEIVLRDWHNRLFQEGAGNHHHLKVIWVGAEEDPSLPNDFERLSMGRIQRGNQQGGMRDAVHKAFRAAQNAQRFVQCVNGISRSLNHNARVIVIGSLAEPIIGAIGDVLQILHAKRQSHQNWDFLALLTTCPPNSAPRLSDEELQAAAREIGRFTFPGKHWMPDLPGFQGQRNVIDRALIDHLFILEGPDLEQGVAQALSEMLILLTHPTGNQLWGALHRQRRGHEASCHTLGITTLYVPYKEIQDYFASRLAYAVLYGGSQGDRGFLATQPEPQDYSESSLAYIGWLTNNDPRHPLFEALFADSPNVRLPQALPSHLEVERFAEAFRLKISSGLFKLLNDSQGLGLPRAEATFRRLMEHIQHIQKNLDRQFQGAPSRDTGSGLADLKSILKCWSKTTDDLLKQIIAWQEALLPKKTTSSHDLRIPSFRPPPHDRTTPPNLKEKLDRQLERSRQVLEENVSGHVRWAATASEQGMAALDELYETHLRPDLRHGSTRNVYLERIRERICWWIHLAPNQEPQLRLVCVPPEAAWEEGSPPPEQASFAPGHLEPLYETIYNVARSQVQGIGDSLRSWLISRFDQETGSRLQSPRCLLTFDENRAVELRGNNPVSVAAFAVSPPQSRSSLPLRDAERVTVLGEVAMQITMLKIWFDIPLAAISRLQSNRRTHHTRGLYLYPQEQNAALYESRCGETDMQLHPLVTMLLWDLRLVSLFFQALFWGLLELKERGRTLGEQWWVMREVEGYGPLDLAASNQPLPLSLLEAFKAWTVQKPLDPDLHCEPDQHPFRRVDSYIRALHDAIRGQRQSRPDSRRHFEQEILPLLREEADRVPNPELKGFMYLLNCELDLPMWEGD